MEDTKNISIEKSKQLFDKYIKLIEYHNNANTTWSDWDDIDLNPLYELESEIHNTSRNLFKSYVKCILEEIIEYFPTIRVQYEYDSIGDTHMILFDPLTMDDDEGFILLISDIYKFCTKFKDGLICIINNESWYEMKNPEIILCGKLYKNS